jgi:hypothetical protein
MTPAPGFVVEPAGRAVRGVGRGVQRVGLGCGRVWSPTGRAGGVIHRNPDTPVTVGVQTLLDHAVIADIMSWCLGPHKTTLAEQCKGYRAETWYPSTP